MKRACRLPGWPLALAMLCVACGEAAVTPGGLDADADATADLAGDSDVAPDTVELDLYADSAAPPVDTRSEPDSDTAPGDAPDDTVQDTALPPVDEGPARYPEGAIQSPVTAGVLETWTAIAARDGALRSQAFIKVGDSITVSSAFLHCFAGSNVDLGAHGGLQGALDHFRALTVAGGTTSFDRTSLAAEVGRSASWAVSGSPSPLDQEISALAPRFSVVMYGTNDLGWYDNDHPATLRWWFDNMLEVVDTQVAAGIIPVLTTLPPRDDHVGHDRWVPTFNLTLRALAEAYQLPLVDYHRALVALPGHGLSGDGVHPNSYGGGACQLTTDGLQYGYNTRNLVTLQALDRLYRAVVLQEVALEPMPAPLAGTGAPADPWIVDRLPFTHAATTAGVPHRDLDVYDGCASSANEGGPELFYRLEVLTRSSLRVSVVDRGAADIDLHVLDATGTTAGCLARAHTALGLTLEPGTYFIVADTFVSSGVEAVGDYFLSVHACAPGDPDC